MARSECSREGICNTRHETAMALPTFQLSKCNIENKLLKDFNCEQKVMLKLF